MGVCQICGVSVEGFFTAKCHDCRRMEAIEKQRQNFEGNRWKQEESWRQILREFEIEDLEEKAKLQLEQSVQWHKSSLESSVKSAEIYYTAGLFDDAIRALALLVVDPDLDESIELKCLAILIMCAKEINNQKLAIKYSERFELLLRNYVFDKVACIADENLVGVDGDVTINALKFILSDDYYLLLNALLFLFKFEPKFDLNILALDASLFMKKKILKKKKLQEANIIRCEEEKKRSIIKNKLSGLKVLEPWATLLAIIFLVGFVCIFLWLFFIDAFSRRNLGFWDSVLIFVNLGVLFALGDFLGGGHSVDDKNIFIEFEERNSLRVQLGFEEINFSTKLAYFLLFSFYAFGAVLFFEFVNFFFEVNIGLFYVINFSIFFAGCKVVSRLETIARKFDQV